MKKFGYLLFVFIFLISGCRMKSSFVTPEKQFVYIQDNTNIWACQKSDNVCVPAGSGKGHASGFLIAHKNNKSYYLTAGHVCIDDFKSQNNRFVAKIDSELHLLDYDGEDIVATIVAIDKVHDICLLETRKVKHVPAIMARKSLIKHSSVINVAAPAAIWSQDLMLHFTGEYQGERLTEEHGSQSIFTLTAQPGSSGSAIYDPITGRVVGIVTHVLGPSFSISFGPTTEQINAFLKINLPK